MPTAFVLSGGGSLGAVQVGMLQALHERGIGPDLLIGTSAGALNAAYLAGRGFSAESIAGLAAHWIGARRSDCFPITPVRHISALAGRRSSLFAAGGLRRTITANLAVSRLEQSVIPVHLIATDLLSGFEVVLSEGDAVGAVLASSAIPALLPPVERYGQVLVDGALADNTAISVAVALGADQIVVLPTGYACALTSAPRSALGVAMQSLAILIQQRLIVDVTLYEQSVELLVLPPLCPQTVTPGDFGHAASLIARARESSLAWIDSGGLERPDPGRVLALHSHIDDEARTNQ